MWSPFSFEWSTGDTSQFIYVSQTGTYCVTVTNLSGCTATDCHTLYPNNVVSLNVYTLDSLDGVSAEVYVIQYDTAQGGIQRQTAAYGGRRAAAGGKVTAKRHVRLQRDIQKRALDGLRRNIEGDLA